LGLPPGARGGEAVGQRPLEERWEVRWIPGGDYARPQAGDRGRHQDPQRGVLHLRRYQQYDGQLGGGVERLRDAPQDPRGIAAYNQVDEDPRAPAVQAHAELVEDAGFAREPEAPGHGVAPGGGHPLQPPQEAQQLPDRGGRLLRQRVADLLHGLELLGGHLAARIRPDQRDVGAGEGLAAAVALVPEAYGPQRRPVDGGAAPGAAQRSVLRPEVRQPAHVAAAGVLNELLPLQVLRAAEGAAELHVEPGVAGRARHGAVGGPGHPHDAGEPRERFLDRVDSGSLRYLARCEGGLRLQQLGEHGPDPRIAVGRQGLPQPLDLGAVQAPPRPRICALR
jgi:hypothetical protein